MQSTNVQPGSLDLLQLFAEIAFLQHYMFAWQRQENPTR